jgi:hypothetical protein
VDEINECDEPSQFGGFPGISCNMIYDNFFKVPHYCTALITLGFLPLEFLVIHVKSGRVPLK